MEDFGTLGGSRLINKYPLHSCKHGAMVLLGKTLKVSCYKKVNEVRLTLETD